MTKAREFESRYEDSVNGGMEKGSIERGVSVLRLKLPILVERSRLASPMAGGACRFHIWVGAPGCNKGSHGFV